MRSEMKRVIQTDRQAERKKSDEESETVSQTDRQKKKRKKEKTEREKKKLLKIFSYWDKFSCKSSRRLPTSCSSCRTSND